MPEPVEGTRPYVAGLDGIRAVAVLGVIAYHVDLGWAAGGLLGVGVFFVLSGYLITDLLVSEFRRHHRIDLRRFWLRRARRLLPALFLMLFAVIGWATLFDGAQLPRLRQDLPSALAYYSNWWFIYEHVSYFARFGPPSPLGHLWSLAIEEQFYLVWPLALLVGLRWLRSRKALVTIAIAAAVASALEMGVLASPLGDPTRVYDGTDTRAFALLIGCALALAWPRGVKVTALTPGARRVLELAGGSALVGIVVLFCATNEYETFLYPAGMLLCALFSTVLIAVTIHPGARLATLLGVAPLRWIGKRSYGIYLWSYPVIVLTTPVGARPGPLRSALDIAAAFGLAALSWRFVEEPIRHGGLALVRRRVRSWRWSLRQLSALGKLAASIALVNAVICTVGLSGLVRAPSLDPDSSVTAILPVAAVPARPTKTTDASGRARTTHLTTETLGSKAAPLAGTGITAIGDSIMIDAAPYLRQLLPGIVIDAVEGQQLYEVQAAVPKLRAEGAIGSRLIVELGTNGSYSPAQLVQLLRSLGPLRRIVLVNACVARPWEQEVNETIAKVAKTHPNVTVVNWFALGAAHLNYFYPDDVHLNPEGARYYASMIAAAINGPAPPNTAVRPPNVAR